MPGEKSLSANQYYAHPQNSFWKILFSIYKENFSDDYTKRTQLLKNNKIALWDVLKSCQRIGSLDSNIKTDSTIVNDFQSFFSNHTDISKIYFNGQKAHQLFKRNEINNANDFYANYKVSVLPSTSPAHASIKWTEKLAVWRENLLD